PSGTRARVYCRPLSPDGPPGDGVVHVKLMEQAAVRTAADAGPKKPMFLPGLVGSAPLWLRGCSQVEGAYHSGEWLAREGGPGVGKLAGRGAVQQRHAPAGRLSVLDAADAAQQDWQVQARRELLESQGTVVVRHITLLGARQLNALSCALQEA